MYVVGGNHNGRYLNDIQVILLYTAVIALAIEQFISYTSAVTDIIV